MFPLRKKQRRKTDLVAVFVCEGGVAVAYAETKGKTRQLSKAAFLEVSDPLRNPHRVKEALEKAGFSDHSHCVLVLSPGEYNLLLVEAPSVPAGELSDALLWRIKDLISYPVEDVQLDYIELPDDAFRGRGKMLYAVAAERVLIEKRLAWLQEIGLEPVRVDVPETALLNITETLCDAEMGTAVLLLQPKQSVISMMSSGSLYLVRSLNYSPTQVESLTLDLQRSMDYYESQIGKPPCVRIMILPLQVGETPLMQELRQNLGADVQSVDLGDVLETAFSLTVDLQQKCLIPMAAALQEESAQ